MAALALSVVAWAPVARAADDAPAAEVEQAAPPEPVLDRPRKVADVSAIFSDDFELRYWHLPTRLPGFEDRDVLDYMEGVNRFTGTIRSKRWSVYGQLDAVALMANTYFLDDVRQQERELLSPGTWSLLVPGKFDPTTHSLSGWDLVSRNAFVNLEKLRVSYDAPAFTFQVGDVYAAFGRGIALNVNRNVDIDIDTSIQGVKVLYRPGNWDLQAVVGQLNRQQVFQDNPNRDLFGDVRHTVGGVRAEVYGLGPVNLGAHGVVYNFADDPGLKAGFDNLASAPDAVVGGGNVEILGAGPTDWYLEGDAFVYPTDKLLGGDENKPGYALYSSTAVYAGPTTWLVEFKRYKDAERVNSLLAPELYEIAIAPTLEYERQITEDSAATLNSNDVWGGRVRMDWAAVPGELVPYWSMAVFRDLEIGGLHFNDVPETVYHPMVGVEWTHNAWAVLFNAGYRIDDRDGTDKGMDRHLHGDLIWKIPLTADWSFDVSAAAEWYRWGDNPIQQTDYAEMETAFAVGYRNIVTFIWYTDYSDNPLIDSRGNLSDTMYGAGEIQVKPIPNLTLRAFFGAYKSGIRCAGGQCRVLPGFEGGRVSVTANF